jgi:hypothetical protein
MSFPFVAESCFGLESPDICTCHGVCPEESQNKIDFGHADIVFPLALFSWLENPEQGNIQEQDHRSLQRNFGTPTLGKPIDGSPQLILSMRRYIAENVFWHTWQLEASQGWIRVFYIRFCAMGTEVRDISKYGLL